MTLFKVTKNFEIIFWSTNTLNRSLAVKRMFKLFGDKIKYDIIGGDK